MMEQAGSSGINSSARHEVEEEDDSDKPDILFSPQDYSLGTGRMKLLFNSKRGRPPKQLDALTVPISNEINYKNIQFPVACDICNNVYANGTILYSHMEKEHANFTPFECRVCCKQFSQMTQLQKHMATHMSNKDFECPICHQRFSRQDCVKVHMRIHDKSKCVHCDVCEKSFLTQAALNIHQRIHRGEKPFRCHLCGKCFTQKNHVIVHIMRHSRVHNQEMAKNKRPRMFQCASCPRAFIRLSDFQRHMQWTHGTVAKNTVAEPTTQVPPSLKQQGKSMRIKAFYEKLSQHYPKKKTLCTTSTQTDNNAGHVIIPSKYQNQALAAQKMEDEMYENEIFDEGMDRNYSSDEEMETEPFMGMTSLGTSMSAVDEAFDAVLRKSGNSATVEKTVEHHSEKSSTNENVPENNLMSKGIITDEIKSNKEVSSALTPKETCREEETEKDAIKKDTTTKIDQVGVKAIMMKSNETIERDTTDKVIINKDESSNIKVTTNKETDITKDTTGKNKETSIGKHMTQNKKVSTIKDTIRKSKNTIFIKDILGKINDEPSINKDITGDPVNMYPFSESQESDLPLMNIYNRNSADVILSRAVPAIKTNFDMSNWSCRERVKTKGRGKNNKLKMIMGLRGASHLRLMRKSLLNYISERNEQSEEEETEMEVENEISAEDQFVDVELQEKLGKRQAKTKQHGKDFLCSSKTCEICQPPIAKPSPKPEMKILKKVKKELPLKEYQDKSNKLLQFILSGDATALEGTDFKLLSQIEGEQQEVFHGYQGSKNFEEPPVEDEIPVIDFQSVCIPTFSCKLCGREFRFEGKLHRHIEAIHQKKVIYTPDVRPGQRRVEESASYNDPNEKKVLTLNPELAALRSDWDDDEDMSENKVATEVTRSKPLFRNMSRKPTYSNQRSVSNLQKQRLQREYASSCYPQSVKLNFNKFAGSPFPEDNMRKKIKTEIPKPMLPKSTSLEMKCSKLLEKLFKMGLLIKCGHNVDHVSVVLGKVLQYYDVKMIEDYGQGQYEVLKYNLWRLIEWKVTMEQMEEFYTQGKSVEEMMDDITNNRVPITAHTEPGERKSTEPEQVSAAKILDASIINNLPIGEQLVISQVALDGNVTQLMLAQDVSPEMLQGARIVTLDPNTGQVISQVTADQVILAGSVSEELTRHIESIDNQIIVSSHPSSSTTTIVSSLPPGSIVANDESMQIGSTTIDGELVVTIDSVPQISGSNT